MAGTFAEAQGLLFTEMNARAREVVEQKFRVRLSPAKTCRPRGVSERHGEADSRHGERRDVRRRLRLCGHRRAQQLPRLLAGLQSRLDLHSGEMERQEDRRGV